MKFSKAENSFPVCPPKSRHDGQFAPEFDMKNPRSITSIDLINGESFIAYFSDATFVVITVAELDRKFPGRFKLDDLGPPSTIV